MDVNGLAFKANSNHRNSDDKDILSKAKTVILSGAIITTYISSRPGMIWNNMEKTQIVMRNWKKHTDKKKKTWKYGVIFRWNGNGKCKI